MNQSTNDHVLAGKNVLVTGGLGFIGSHLTRHLVKLGAKVKVVDSMISDYGGNLFNIKGIEDQVDINFSDIRDAHSLKYLVQNQDYIFNIAGQVSHIDSMNDPVTDLEINCKAQLVLLEACRQENPGVKIVFAGTRQVYGRPESLPVTEKHLVKPIDVNGVNKVAGEYYHVLYHDVYQMKTSVLRLTNTYGPGQLIKHNRQGFTGIFIREAIKGNKIQIFGDGSQIRDFNYVTDVVEALIAAAVSDQAWGKIYNLGAKNHYSLLEFVEFLNAYCDFEFETVPFPKEKAAIDIGDYYSDFSEIKKDLGWEPHIDLKEGLEKTVSFYKKHIEHYL